MPRWCVGLGLLFCLGSGWVGAQKDPGRNPQVLSLRRIESAHMILYFTSDYREFAKPLLDEGEQFLTKLAGRWSVILPNEKMEVSLTGQVRATPLLNHLEQPPWIMTGYDRDHGRVEVRILDRSRFKIHDLLPLFRHDLVHALLSLPRIKQTPFFIQEGLARYYAGESSGHTRFLAVLAFYRYPDVATFFEDDDWIHDKRSFRQASALAGVFIDYLWEHNPKGEVHFVQSLQRGIPWRQAFKDCGFPNWDARVEEFNKEIREEYRWYTLIWTYDLWLILISTTALVWMILCVRNAWKVARMAYVDLPALAEPVAAEELTGPAFGPPSAKLNAPMPKSKAKAQPEPHPPETVVQRSVFPEDYSAPVEGIVPPPRPGASRTVELKAGQIVRELDLPEQELEEALAFLDPKTEPRSAPSPHPEEEAFGAVESELDDVFDALITSPKARKR